ncbi:MAG: shikimate dehydrogenase [Anaerolineales bacterium]|nr:shikimate dehydrogenase [Anaerolineales bacterium]
MIRLGLTGHPLGHSLSPRLHAAALAGHDLVGEYLLYPVKPGDQDGLRALMKRLRGGELNGLNVTIPHKQAVLPLLDECTHQARAIGAVNTLYMKDGILYGHNTDAPGFLADLQRLPLDRSEDRRAIVIGSGGGARAVVAALLQDGWWVTIAAQLMDQAGSLVHQLEVLAGPGALACIPAEAGALRAAREGSRLVVNASPVGMAPNSEASPWPVNLPLPDGAGVYDLVYNPRETLFVRRARESGHPARSGLGMLVEQAALAFACWTGLEPPRAAMFAVAEVGCCDF